MAIPYIPLTDQDKFFHINGMFDDNGIPISGILASGEGNFYDTTQVLSSPPTITYVSPLEPYGLVFAQNSSLSNARISLEYSINDFSTFTPYVHYMPNPNCDIYVLDPLGCAIFINPSLYLNLAVFQYNVGN